MDIGMFKDFNKDKKRLVSNFFSLSSVEVANYIFPLITLPYLVRVLGPEKFGLIAFAQAFVQYFVTLTDYGFNFSATRNISINRDNPASISKIFTSVTLIKSFLFLVSTIILFGLIFLIPRFKSDWLIYLFSFGMIIGNILFPLWLFQGMERMKFIAVLNILAKFIFTISIFIFIKSKADYLYVPLITSLGYIISGLLSMIIIWSQFRIRFVPVRINDLLFEMKEGWHIFISMAAVNLYTTSNTFIVGILTNNTTVGYYSVAEKLIRVVLRSIGVVSQVVYPYINRLVVQSKVNALRFIKKLLLVFGSIYFLISILLYLFARQIVFIVFGMQYEQSINVLRILSFLPFIVSLSNTFGIQTMLTFNFKKSFSRIIIIAGFLNILLAFLLVPIYKQAGVATSYLTTEVFVTAAMLIYLIKKGFISNSLFRYLKSGGKKFVKLLKIFTKRPNPKNISYVNLALTYKCNSRCKHCNIWKLYVNHPEEKEKELDAGIIKQLFIKSKYLKNLKGIVLSGGEPFLSDNFADLCGFFISQYPKAGIIVPTNARDFDLITNKIRKIYTHNKTKNLYLSVSLDGIDKTHDDVRGSPGNYISVLKLIEYFKREYPLIKLGVSFTITPENYLEILDVYQLSQDLNIGFGIQFAQNSSTFYKNTEKEFKWSREQLEEIQKAISLVAKRYESNQSIFRKIDDTNLYYLIHMVNYYSNPQLMPKCYSGTHSVFIDPYGNLFPCVMLNVNLGNVQKCGFDNLWLSKKARNTRLFINSKRCGCWTPCEASPSLANNPRMIFWNLYRILLNREI